MDSNVVVKALLESAIDTETAILKNATDAEIRDRSKRRIEYLKKLQKGLFSEPETAEISKAELDEIFNKLEKTVYPEGRTPPGQT